MPKGIPQSKRLKPKKGYNIITVYNAKNEPIRQRYVKTKGPIQAVKEFITDKPGENATGTGGRRRERKVMEAVDEAVDGAS